MSDRLATIQSEAYLPQDRSINHWSRFDDPYLENAHRLHALAGDRWLSTLGMGLSAACFLAFIWVDYLFYGISGTFWMLLKLRAAIVLSTIAAATVIRRASTRVYDVVLFSWIALASIGYFAIVSTRGEVHLAEVRFDIIILCGIYVVFNMDFLKQAVLGLAFTMTLMIALIVNPSIPVTGSIAIIASALFVNLSGMAVSWRLHWLARRQFLSTQLEKELGLELEKLAFTDSLTGISNRRDFMVHASAELQRHRRHDRPFTLLLLDLDYFKRVNDRYGHDVGDRVLRDFAQILESQVRGLDIAARMGGEEFAILLPETLSGGAIEVAARIQSQTRQMRFGTDGDGSCTVSIGLAGVWPDDESVEDILKRTDEAMYRAKAEGRDRMVSVAQPINPQVNTS